MVCAIADQNVSEWGCYGSLIPGADGFAIGTGAQNTADILAGCSGSGIAAKVCDDLVLNDYTDWFLPSMNELDEMFLNKAAIDATAVAHGGSSFNPTLYWSSTEHTKYLAWGMPFSNGIPSHPLKHVAASVRAVRNL